jgi:hypothetical protein
MKYQVFEYAIQRPDGRYFNGNAHSDDRDWSEQSLKAFTYTEAGAYRKIERFPSYFSNCKVIRVS